MFLTLVCFFATCLSVFVLTTCVRMKVKKEHVHAAVNTYPKPEPKEKRVYRYPPTLADEAAGKSTETAKVGSSEAATAVSKESPDGQRRSAELIKGSAESTNKLSAEKLDKRTASVGTLATQAVTAVVPSTTVHVASTPTPAAHVTTVSKTIEHQKTICKDSKNSVTISKVTEKSKNKSSYIVSDYDKDRAKTPNVPGSQTADMNIIPADGEHLTLDAIDKTEEEINIHIPTDSTDGANVACDKIKDKAQNTHKKPLETTLDDVVSDWESVKNKKLSTENTQPDEAINNT